MRPLALAGLVLTLVLHLATFVPGIRIPSGVIPVAFLVAIVPFASTILSANRYRPRFTPPPDDHASGWLAAWGRDMDAQKSLSAYAFRAVPTWAKEWSGPRVPDHVSGLRAMAG
jgi:hypothetical protein